MDANAPTVVSPMGRTGLQLLRVAGICLLIAYHAALVTPLADQGGTTHIVHRLSGAGWVGTDLFLAISGFLAFDSRQRCDSQLRWLCRRAIRVLPAYWTFLLLYLHVLPAFVVALWGHQQLPSIYGTLGSALGNQAYFFTLTANLLMARGHWVGAALEPLLTIAVGAQLALLTCTIMPFRRGYGFLAAAGVLECVGVFLRFLWRNDICWRCYSFPLTRCDAFVLGLVAAWALHHEGWRAHLAKAAPAVGVVGVSAGLIAALCTQGLIVCTRRTALVGYPLVGFSVACIVLATSQAGFAPSTAWAPPRKLVCARSLSAWVRLAGAATFGTYLVKLPVMYTVLDELVRRRLSPSVAVLVVLGGTAAFFVGWVWFELVESPLSRMFGRYLR